MEYDISEKQGEKRFTWVDSLKGIGICAVVWVHTGGGGLGTMFDPLADDKIRIYHVDFLVFFSFI